MTDAGSSGCVTIDGRRAETVSWADAEVTEPAWLVTTTSYMPASAIASEPMENVEPRSPEMFTPFLRH